MAYPKSGECILDHTDGNEKSTDGKLNYHL